MSYTTIDRRGFLTSSAAATAIGAAPTMNTAAPSLASTSVGEGRDILFLHGWMMDSRDERRTYEPVFRHRNGWRRHYLDLPGMGRSPPDTTVRSLDNMLDHVVEWIDRHIGRKPMAVAGTSAGGHLALGVLSRRREHVTGLLLRAPVVEPDDARRDVDVPEPILRDADVEKALSDRERAAGPLLVQTPSYARARRAKLEEAVMPAMAVADTAFLSDIRDDPSRFRLRGVPGQMKAFDGPSLIVTGRLDDSVGFRDAWRLVPKLTRATFVVLDRAEHGLPIDQQTLFEALVVDWLDRLSEAASFSR